MKIISLNWTDNTGKTTHAKLLTLKNDYNVALIWSIAKYDNRWQTKANHDQKDWWTSSDNEDAFMSLFVESILARNVAIERLKNVDIAILDRGLTMLESTVVSNLQIKKWISKETAENLFNDFVIKHYGKIKNLEDASILLHYSDNISENVDYTIANNQCWEFSDQENQRYRIYQKYLNENLIDNLIKFDSSIKANTPIMITQNTIRQNINEKLWYNIPLFWENIDMIYGVGWSSEAWKSSFWEISRKNHNFVNLKLKYFSEIIKQKYPNLTPDSEEFGMHMIVEIDKFADTHYYFKRYSLESLRYPWSVVFFKKFRGEKFKSIFIDSDKGIRINRYADDNNIDIEKATQAVLNKDNGKKDEWAFEIEKISDYGLYNNDSFQRRQQKIANIHALNEYENKQAYELQNLSELGLPENYTLALKSSIDVCKKEFGDSLRLLILSWSAGRQDIIDGFSDLDIFLVISGITQNHAESFRLKYRFFNDIKIWYTLLDSKNIKEQDIDPKVDYIFRNIRSWEFPVIYWSNISIPKKHVDKENESKKNYISTYINDTDKELHAATTGKEVLDGIKHLHTIMKILLAIHWIQKEWYKQVNDTFYEKFKNFSFPHIHCVADIWREEKIEENYRYNAIKFIRDLKVVLKELIEI